MLAISHRTVEYGRRAALDDVSLAVNDGERVAVIGPNGAGKTTLLKALAEAAGKTESGAPGCAFVPSDEGQVPSFSGRDYVMLGRTPHLSAWRRPGSADEAAVDRAIASVGAEALARRRVDTLSSGELRRLSLALALATGAPALLLDEPTAHIDAAGRAAFFDLLRRIGRTIVMTMHDFPLPRGFFTRAVLLRAGRLEADGPPAEVLARYLDDTQNAR